jgi:hypothetical protein
MNLTEFQFEPLIMTWCPDKGAGNSRLAISMNGTAVMTLAEFREWASEIQMRWWGCKVTRPS